MVKNDIPDRWLPYSPMGTVIAGTRFVACKVPLKEILLKKLPEKERFGPDDLMKAFPNIGLLIDLTFTDRYYDKKVFTTKNIKYEKILCPGKEVPPNSIVKKFFRAVDDFLAKTENSDSLIVVHCTHGVNRTGYFICRYMIEKLNIPPEEAIEKFLTARGHNIERENYVNDLKNGCKGGSESSLRYIPFPRNKGDDWNKSKRIKFNNDRNHDYYRSNSRRDNGNRRPRYEPQDSDRSRNSLSRNEHSSINNWRIRRQLPPESDECSKLNKETRQEYSGGNAQNQHAIEPSLDKIRNESAPINSNWRIQEHYSPRFPEAVRNRKQTEASQEYSRGDPVSTKQFAGHFQTILPPPVHHAYGRSRQLHHENPPSAFPNHDNYKRHARPPFHHANPTLDLQGRPHFSLRPDPPATYLLAYSSNREDNVISPHKHSLQHSPVSQEIESLPGTFQPSSPSWKPPPHFSYNCSPVQSNSPQIPRYSSDVQGDFSSQHSFRNAAMNNTGFVNINPATSNPKINEGPVFSDEKADARVRFKDQSFEAKNFGNEDRNSGIFNQCLFTNPIIKSTFESVNPVEPVLGSNKGTSFFNKKTDTVIQTGDEFLGAGRSQPRYRIPRKVYPPQNKFQNLDLSNSIPERNNSTKQTPRLNEGSESLKQNTNDRILPEGQPGGVSNFNPNDRKPRRGRGRGQRNSR